MIEKLYYNLSKVVFPSCKECRLTVIYNHWWESALMQLIQQLETLKFSAFRNGLLQQNYFEVLGLGGIAEEDDLRKTAHLFFGQL